MVLVCHRHWKAGEQVMDMQFVLEVEGGILTENGRWLHSGLATKESAYYIRLPTEAEVREYLPLRDRKLAERQERDAKMKEHDALRKSPEYSTENNLANAIGSRSPEELLEHYGPARIIAAWRALEGE